MSNDKELDDFYKVMESMTLLQLAEIMNDIRIELEEVKAISTGFQKKYDALRLNLIPSAMDDDGISTITIEGIGRLSLTSDIYASIPAAQREEAWEWLREHKLGDIIKETVHAGTLKATLKSLLKKGEEEIPEDLFKVTPYTRASITKR